MSTWDRWRKDATESLEILTTLAKRNGNILANYAKALKGLSDTALRLAQRIVDLEVMTTRLTKRVNDLETEIKFLKTEKTKRDEK